MESPHNNRMAASKRRGPPSKFETATPLPEKVTEFVDLPQRPLRGIASPPCCGVAMHPQRTGASGGKVYAKCGHCGVSLVVTVLDADRVHVRVAR